MLVEEFGAELDAVFGAQLEDLADLDALPEQQGLAFERIAFDGEADALVDAVREAI